MSWRKLDELGGPGSRRAILQSLTRALPLLVVGAASLPALAPSAPPTDRLAEAFVAALIADDQAALEALAVDGTSDSGAFREPLVVMGRYRDIAARTVSVTQKVEGDRWVVSLALDGKGTTAGGRKEVEVLPRRWRLEAVEIAGVLKLASATTRERQLATQLASAKREEIEAAFTGDPELDAHDFLEQLADTASDAGAEGAAALDWVEATSRARRDHVALVSALRMRSYVAFGAGDTEAAIRHAEAALAVATASGDADSIAACRFSLGVAHWQAGQRRAAVESLRGAVADIGRLRDPRTALRSLYMAGIVEHDVRARLEIALELERWLAVYPSPRGEMDADFLRAFALSTLGSVGPSQAAYEEALAGAERLQDFERQVIALLDLAIARELQDDPAGAHALVRRASALAPKIAPARGLYLAIRIGEVELEAGNLPAAEQAFARAVELAEQQQTPALVSNALAAQSGLRLRQRRPEEALALASRAVAVYVPSAMVADFLPLDPWVAYTQMARALVALDRPSEAEAAYRAAIDEVHAHTVPDDADQSSAPRQLSSRIEPYRELVDLLVAERRPREALLAADQLRAQSLRNQLMRGRIDLGAKLSAEESARRQALEQRLVSLNRTLLGSTPNEERERLGAERSAARLELERYLTELHTLHTRWADRRDDVPAGSVEAWGRAIPPDGLVVELMVGEDSTLAFLISRGVDGALDVSAQRLPAGAAELGPQIDALSAALAGGDPAFAGPARALYEALVAPWADRLAGVKVLCVVPDGILWRVPFQVLRNANGQSLIERLAVFRAPSLTALALARERPRTSGPPSVLALGDPAVAGRTASRVAAVERGPSLGPLPDAAREVREIVRLYGEERSELHTGAAARERLLKERAGTFDIIHLATHSLLDDDAPLFSALLLAAAPEDGEDGLLEMREVSELDLRARLTVLSACESGGGRLHPGEGMVGLSWAFLAAGVPTLVVSDWNAPSAATAALMVELHRQLRRGLPSAEALRQAQLAIRRDPQYAHPYYWAGFTVLGDGW